MDFIISTNLSTAASTRTKRERGSLQYLFPDNYVVLDIETTGLNAGYDDILEVGAIKVEDGEIVDKYTSLINPNFPDSYSISGFITNLTGITSDEITDDGRTIETVLSELKSFVGDSLIVAHNATFDLNFLYDAFLENFGIKFSNNYVDTLQIARHYAFKSPIMRSHRVSDFVKEFKLEYLDGYDQEHRALNDCYLEMQILNLEKEKLGADWTKPKYHQEYVYKPREKFEANTEADPDNPFFGLNIVFTGKLTKFTRNEASEFVASLGANPESGVKKDTDLLIVGVQTSSVGDDGKSSKQEKAERFNEEGRAEISIITDDDFLQMIADYIN